MKKPFWGGDPGLERILDEFSSELGASERAEKADQDAECDIWLGEAKETIHGRILGFLPYNSYDRAWGLIHQIRHRLCRILSPEKLLIVVLQIRANLDYISDPGHREELHKELAALERSMAAHNVSAETQTLGEQRLRLEQISRFTAEARESHWRKINLLRMRLVATTLFLAAFLLLSLGLVPLVLSDAGIGPGQVLAMIVFGALGGLVSALRSTEPLNARASDYFLQRTLLGLRPVVGAAAGLLIYLIQLSGILTLLPDASHPGAVHLTLAFTAGFSERFFIGQIEHLAKRGSGTARDQEYEPDKEGATST
ncbi:hypothetical protein SAMN05660860_02239 [Geoalkalibacter ferrihydriticus]|uniref:Uncharacterized protein n=1 Tax=Geoalkalibacter ferrihydriticus TaxID=392333 RepID=A0A1G9S5D5_9BACT|nr:hypothetical protein [Geoalkalibacter ferrihydriticus]SDM30500.1 hypothetical protein SAMN05660860_02239 [Geoalkalibacter ferrihydriticus]